MLALLPHGASGVGCLDKDWAMNGDFAGRGTSGKTGSTLFILCNTHANKHHKPPTGSHWYQIRNESIYEKVLLTNCLAAVCAICIGTTQDRRC